MLLYVLLYVLLAALLLFGSCQCSVSICKGVSKGGAEDGGLKCPQVEAGLDDLRAAYAELHQELGSGSKPPEEKERIAQHVSSNPGPSCSILMHHQK